jgi:hypothetical protein
MVPNGSDAVATKRRAPISKAWSEADLEKLLKLQVEGASLLRASASLKRPPSSIKKRAKVLGLHFPGVREIRREITAREI